MLSKLRFQIWLWIFLVSQPLITIVAVGQQEEYFSYDEDLNNPPHVPEEESNNALDEGSDDGYFTVEETEDAWKNAFSILVRKPRVYILKSEQLTDVASDTKHSRNDFSNRLQKLESQISFLKKDLLKNKEIPENIITSLKRDNDYVKDYVVTLFSPEVSRGLFKYFSLCDVVYVNKNPLNEAKWYQSRGYKIDITSLKEKQNKLQEDIDILSKAHQNLVSLITTVPIERRMTLAELSGSISGLSDATSSHTESIVLKTDTDMLSIAHTDGRYS